MNDIFDTDSTHSERTSAGPRRPGRLAQTRRRVAVAAAAVGFTTMGLVGIASADSTTPANTYSACLSKLQVIYNVTVNDTSAPRCLGKDTAITWNQTGPAGPAGAAGAQGLQGEKGE